MYINNSLNIETFDVIQEINYSLGKAPIIEATNGVNISKNYDVPDGYAILTIIPHVTGCWAYNILNQSFSNRIGTSKIKITLYNPTGLTITADLLSEVTVKIIIIRKNLIV